MGMKISEGARPLAVQFSLQSGCPKSGSSDLGFPEFLVGLSSYPPAILLPETSMHELTKTGRRLTTCMCILGMIALLSAPRTEAQDNWKFDCGAKHAAYARQLTASSIYTASSSFGFDLTTVPASFTSTSCVGNAPFFFSVSVPEGNYLVKLVLGDEQTASVTTVKAEARRLMVGQLKTAPEKFRSEVFTVNVRTPEISPTERVHLKQREIGNLDWDNRLTLEFDGDRPSFRSIEIKKVTGVTTLYLAGDSTVVDQDKEPWAAWGQMLPVFFGPKVSVANHAESGETIHSFVTENRFAKIFSIIRPGDYLFMQFAHNDQKPGRGFVSIPEYKRDLRQYIEDARKHGATPVLVTSMNRRSFDGQGHIIQTLGGYPQAMRETARDEHAALIDLNAMSKTLFEALGPQGTLRAFVHYPAHSFPNQDEPLSDNTHFNNYGAYELARCIVDGVRENHLPIAKDLRKGVQAFDPAHPDPVESWSLPLTPMASASTPYER